MRISHLHPLALSMAKLATIVMTLENDGKIMGSSICGVLDGMLNKALLVQDGLNSDDRLIAQQLRSAPPPPLGAFDLPESQRDSALVRWLAISILNE